MSSSNWMIRVCWVLSCLGCWLTRGQDSEKVDEVGSNESVTRPVNIFIINEEENKVANKSILAALKSIREKQGNSLGKVWSVQTTESSWNDTLNELCNSWERAVVKDGSENKGEDGIGVPDFVLDTTRSGLGAKITNWFTASLGIPTLSAQYGEKDDLVYWRQLSNDQEKYLIQVIPPGDLVPEAIPELVKLLDMTNAAILFDHDFAMDRKYDSLMLNIPTRHIIKKVPQSLSEMTKRLPKLRNLGLINYFLLGAGSTLNMALEAAEASNVTGRKYGWFMLTLEEEIWPTCQCRNMTVLFMQPERKREKRAVVRTSLPKPLLSSGFYYDLTLLGIQAIKSAIDNGKWPFQPKHILCDAANITNTPQRDVDLLSILKESYNNISPTFAPINWGEKNGEHQAQFNMSINLVRIEDGDISARIAAGSWQASIHSPFEVRNKTIMYETTAVKMYRVVTIINPPFIMYDEKEKRWYGFCIDLLEKIRATVKFEYEIREVDDKEYGKLNEDGSWNGMMKELIDKEADIALGTLWVMAERAKVVDFTMPFYDLVGLSILMLKKKTSTSPLKYLGIFENKVWCSILVAYLFTSSLLWIFDRLSPCSYLNNKDKNRKGGEKPMFNLRECFWFCLTSLTPQGGGESPKNLSGRLIAATWWLFGFAIVVSYTANLTAFVTVPRLDPPIESIETLSKQHRVEYAPVLKSAAYSYFERMANIERKFYDIWKDASLGYTLPEMESAEVAVWDYPMSNKYTKIFQAMSATGFPNSTKTALQRVRQRNFAYIEDSTTIRYLVMTNCDLTQIGNDFSRRPYAIAVQQGSPLKAQFNDAILKLVMKQTVRHLKTKWWGNNPARRNCDAENNQSDGINIRNIGGVFAVVFMGIIFASFALAFEYWYFRDKAKGTLRPR